MTGTVCLQGGGEFSAACGDMDAALVGDADGPVVVSALAGAPGREYATANRNGVAHLQRLTRAEVVAAPDLREDPEAGLAALAAARVLVLPGGSPARLLDALVHSAAGQLIGRLLADGGTVVGSSAGAMVLGAFTVLPERRPPAVVPGLGSAANTLVLPHWSGSRPDWLAAIDDGTPPGTLLLGIPEESGLVLQAGRLTAVGRSASRLLRQGRTVAPGDTLTLEELA